MILAIFSLFFCRKNFFHQFLYTFLQNLYNLGEKIILIINLIRRVFALPVRFYNRKFVGAALLRVAVVQQAEVVVVVAAARLRTACTAAGDALRLAVEPAFAVF